MFRQGTGPETKHFRKALARKQSISAKHWPSQKRIYPKHQLCRQLRFYRIPFFMSIRVKLRST